MKKRVIAVLISAILLYQPLSVSAAAAPDGMTDASKTPAAQNGAWDAWCEEWETIKTDWTQVAMSPGSDETEMNFAWYTKEGEEASFVYGQTPDLSDGQSAAVSESPAQTGYKSSKVVIKDLKPGTTYYYQVGRKRDLLLYYGCGYKFLFLYFRRRSADWFFQSGKSKDSGGYFKTILCGSTVRSS